MALFDVAFSKKQLFSSSIKATACAAAALMVFGLTSCGGGGGSSSPTPQAVVPPPPPPPPPPPASNAAPVVNSPSKTSVAENTTAAFFTLSVSDPDNDTISSVEVLGSGDGAFFTADTQSLGVSAATSIDFEQFADADADNIFDITLRVTDSRGASTDFPLEITVDDVPDNFSFGLQASMPPSGNFDLLDWKMDLPINDAGGLTGDSAKVDEDDMAAGYTNADYFYTGPDGGMVMRAPSQGATTSANTRYTRTELREMLRRGDRSISTRGAG